MAGSDITLTSGVRTNLLSLQRAASQTADVNNRLATGKKVNSALDNPTNFFTAASLVSRSNDLSNLLDSMSNGIQTIQAADNGLSSITDTLESMQSTLRQARQDKSFETVSLDLSTFAARTSFTGTEALTLSGGQFGTGTDTIALTKTVGGTTTPASAATVTTGNFGSTLTFDDAGDELSFDIALNGASAPTTVTINSQTLTDAGIAGGTIDDVNELQTAVNQALTDAGVTGVTVGVSGSALTFTSSTTGAASEIDISNVTANDAGGADTLSNTSGIAAVSDTGSDATTTGGTIAAKSVDELVNDINNDTSLKGKIKASNDNGKLRIQNLSTQDLSIDGVTASGVIDASSTDAMTVDGNKVRADLATQFNDLRDQLDKYADDASFNGINLLRGDLLKLTFNETGTSTIDIQTENGESVDSNSLGIDSIQAADLDSDATIDAKLDVLGAALKEIRSVSSTFGSNLSVVENRQSFTKEMMNTLQTGADNLTLADSNEEGANLMALQTRSQLATTALSFAVQADQTVLRFLG